MAANAVFAGPAPEAPQEVTSPRFAAIDAILERAIAAGELPGAVVVIGHGGEVVYRRALGARALVPSREPMTLDTIFDIASLTKPLATATSVMRLVELGQVRLNDPVARYIPEFGRNGKEDITIRQLLTHFSGLRDGLDLRTRWSGYDAALRLACDETPVAPPGSRFLYSDINYIVLGELVARLSGLPLDKYSDVHIFQPLKMRETRFRPPPSWLPRIAPTEFDERGRMLRGVVHDPTARRMGGVAGQAGLFSTAADLSRFAQAMLDQKVLSPLILEKMTTPQQPPTATVLRGLGWDIDSPFASNRGDLLPVGGYGHTGYTGASLWIDPYTRTYIIILANAVHPRAGTNTVSLRSRVATAAATALRLTISDEDKRRLAAITGYNEAMAGSRRLAARNGSVRTGIDVLQSTGFAALKGTPEKPRVIGVLTNQTGLDAEGRRTVDLLHAAPGIKLAAIFSPEHGIFGALDTEEIPDTVDAATGVPVYSLYRKGRRGRPTPELLRGLDAVVFDVQDAGVRFYSYEVTLGYTLEAAAAAGVEVIVLDRPNPITGSFVQGPLSSPGPQRLATFYSVPVRHGMTLGELGQMFNAERKLGARLKVIPMQGWQRGDWFDSTGAGWVNPSPNLRSVTQATLYPGVALVEGTNVSVGRGTATPFEVLGAPWVRARELADYLNRRNIAGVRFVPVSFTPNESKYANQLCHGVNLIVTDRNAFDAPQLGIELAAALRRLYPGDYQIERMIEILANQGVFDAIQRGDDPRRIADDWRDDLDRFSLTRQKYLLY